jgi:hypothetical protein
VVYRNSNTLVMKIESGLPRSDKFVHCLPASLNGSGNLAKTAVSFSEIQKGSGSGFNLFPIQGRPFRIFKFPLHY